MAETAGVPGRSVVWVDVVGLTPRLLEHAPRLHALAARGSGGALRGVVPAVTCTAQATVLTGKAPREHGIVGNGWLHRETSEVRFWLQGHALLQAESVWSRARRASPGFRGAGVFAWFAPGAPLDASVFPKPWYGCDGSKAFGVHGVPEGFPGSLERALGPFPFASFWGPGAGLPSTSWIAAAAVRTIRERRPSLTLVYLPHLDYDLQRRGPQDPGTPRLVAQVDEAAGVVLDAAREAGALVVAFSEYGLEPVDRAVLPNRALREAGWLRVRDGPFGETMDVPACEALAVCDHQVAHVYAADAGVRSRARRLLEGLDGVDRVLEGDERASVGLDHPRSGDLVALARHGAWFAYPYWLDERRAPDFARTVDIHRKPGYDPLELFLDPRLRRPRLRVASRLLRKRLGMRYRMDVVPLDPSLVRGSHGLPPLDPRDGPVLVSEDPAAASRVRSLADLAGHALEVMGLPSGER